MAAENTPETPETPEADVKMTIWEHLQELRSRLLRSFIAVFVTTICAWMFRKEILAWLLRPYEKAWVLQMPNEPLKLQTLSPGDPFVAYLQLSLVAGIILAIPIIFYQLWAFVSPGLYAKEKRYIIPFVLFSTVLFLSGVAFAYYVAFPFTFKYFFSLLGEITDRGTMLTQIPTFEYYLDFSTRMLLSFGAVFELPLFISFLAMAGIVTPRQLLRFGRWAIILSFVLGAIATPGPEITSQIAVSGALIVLYFVSVGVAFLVGKKKDEPPKSDLE
jgi:sec-independent protein translocase protein TatC